MGFHKLNGATPIAGWFMEHGKSDENMDDN